MRCATTEYLIAEQTCLAIADRHDPEMMRCFVCRLVWETSDRNPPRCRARSSPTKPARRGDHDKFAVT
jgi:hypothetical protein